MIITVLTATWNRAHSLPRLFDSLLRQTDPGFEWVVADDGSADDTREVVEEMARRAPFPVRYLRQENGGRHTALNRGAAVAAGELLVVMDSDDWFDDRAIERFRHHWESIPAGERGSFAAVAGLCAYPGGGVIGTLFPAPVFDSDFLSIRAVHRVAGDKKELFRTELVRRHPFPEFPGERRVPFSYLLNRLAAEGRARFFNEVVAVKEYLPDGLSAKIDRVRMESPLGSRLGSLEVAAFPGPLPWRFRARKQANCVRYALHAGDRPWSGMARWRAPWLAVVSVPLGYLLYQRDRSRARKGVVADRRPTGGTALC